MIQYKGQCRGCGLQMTCYYELHDVVAVERVCACGTIYTMRPPAGLPSESGSEARGAAGESGDQLTAPWMPRSADQGTGELQRQIQEWDDEAAGSLRRSAYWSEEGDEIWAEKCKMAAAVYSKCARDLTALLSEPRPQSEADEGERCPGCNSPSTYQNPFADDICAECGHDYRTPGAGRSGACPPNR